MTLVQVQTIFQLQTHSKNLQTLWGQTYGLHMQSQYPDWDLWVQIPRIQLYGFSPIGVFVAPPPSYI